MTDFAMCSQRCNWGEQCRRSRDSGTIPGEWQNWISPSTPISDAKDCEFYIPVEQEQVEQVKNEPSADKIQETMAHIEEAIMTLGHIGNWKTRQFTARQLDLEFVMLDKRLDTLAMLLLDALDALKSAERE